VTNLSRSGETFSNFVPVKACRPCYCLTEGKPGYGMGKNNIEKYDIFYQLLKKYVDFWHNYIFYRRVIVLGKDTIDFSVPTILAPNHQNALMDAMAVLCTLDGS
jgi:hypothetical protein